MSVRPGLYRHYKGSLYRVLMTAYESTNGRPREELVVYTSDALHNVCVRTAAEFCERVRWDNGHILPRFVYMHDDAPATDGPK